MIDTPRTTEPRRLFLVLRGVAGLLLVAGAIAFGGAIFNYIKHVGEHGASTAAVVDLLTALCLFAASIACCALCLCLKS